jgi:endonuclease YncB( thermonuclease family)
MGTLRINGTIDVAQFWPVGNSDADTTQLKINVSSDSFEFSEDDRTFSKTNVYKNAVVTGKGGKKPAIKFSKRNKTFSINVRLQGVDAPELHYKAPPLPGNSVTEEVRKKYNEVNEDFRQPFGENAAYALGSFLTAKADDEGIVNAVFVSKNIYEPADALDTFGRFVGNILVGRTDINLWLASEGWVIPTFYASMSESEIDAVIKACRKGVKKNRALRNITYDCSHFEKDRILRRDVDEYEEGSDAGLVLVPKFFRRTVNYHVSKASKIFKGSFLKFIQEKAKHDTFMLLDEFLEHDAETADQYRIDDYLDGNTFTLKIDRIVFKEGSSSLKNQAGKKILKF